MKRIVTLLLASLACIGAPGQDTVWSLDSCLAQVMANNISLQAAQAAGRKARAQMYQSLSELLPALDLHVNQYYNWGRSVDMQELVIVKNRLTRQTSASVGASFTIFDGVARLNTYAASRAAARAAENDILQAELEAKCDITKAYLGNVLARLTTVSLQQSLECVRLQLEKIRTEVDCGRRSTEDILEMEARAADLQSQIAQSEAEEALRMQELRRLTGCPAPFETDLAVAEMCESCTPPETGPVVTPGVLSARENAEAARYALKAARGAVFPTIGVSAAYGTYYSDAAGAPFKEQVDGNRNPSVSLSMVVPLFDGGRRAAEVAAAKADLDASRARVRQAEEDALSEWGQMRLQCISLAQQIAAGRAREEFCAKKLASSGRQYELGAISASDWLQAADDLTRSRSELLKCRCKYLFQVKLMELYKEIWHE